MTGCVAALCAIVFAPWPASAQNDPTQITVWRDSRTGRATLVARQDGGAIPVTKRFGAGAVGPIDFLIEYGHAFGVTNPQRQLRQTQLRQDDLGHITTSYQQVHEDIPVFGGELRVHQDAAGRIVAANGEYFPIPQKLSTVARISAEEAVGFALAGLALADPAVVKSDLVIVDPGWYGDAPRGPHLAYHIELVSEADFVHEAFFVDAQDGTVLDRWSRVCSLRDRRIYDANNSGNVPGILARAEGNPVVQNRPDVNKAYDFYGDVYDYYFRAFGRDSIDGQGLPMVATVYFNAPGYCPNAFWSGYLQQMVFCQGAVTDDIVAHELTHGITEFSANLIYQNQPGQMNESFSDIFGELVDLFNGNASVAGTQGGTPWPMHDTGPGVDVPNNLRSACSLPDEGYADGVRWMMGEDAAVFGGAIRDMWNPTCFFHPDSAESIYQRCQPWDSGGVHIGSGVLNHSFAILVDGKTFNELTVTGIGAIKAGAVYYRALTTYLTSVSDFEDAYHLLNQAARDLVGTTPKDPRTGQTSASPFTEADAQQVELALRAVKLDGPGRCGVQLLLDPDPAPICAERVTIFADDFEGASKGWLIIDSSLLPASENWKIISGNLPDGHPGHVYFASNPDAPCSGAGATGLRQLISPEITLPQTLTIPAVRFTHLVQTESYYDGGNVKYRVNGGAWKVVPAEAFRHNPYNLPELIRASQGNTNPLAGQPAFSGWGGQWGTTLIDLRGLVAPGQKLQLAFDMGDDQCVGVAGWYVDDIEVFDCSASTDCNGNGIADDAEIAAGSGPNVIVDQPTSYSAFVQLGLNFDLPDIDFLDFGLAYAENFDLPRTTQLTAVRFWGGYSTSSAGGNDFVVRFRKIGFESLPGEAVPTTPFTIEPEWTDMLVYHSGVRIWQVELSFEPPIKLSAGSYYIEIYQQADAAEARGDFYWELGDFAPDLAYYAVSYEAPGVEWYGGYGVNLSLQLIAGTRGEDCNTNGILDDCESDADCNENGVRDICEIASGAAGDCNGDGVLNECDGDCNFNGVPDGCDIAAGTAEDCNNNAQPDNCEPFNDCNDNLIQDICDGDCNANAYADECDLAGGTSSDCNANNLPDECDSPADCNANGVLDICDIFGGGFTDCDNNLVPDVCQIDFDNDGTIDVCDGCPLDPLKLAPGACGCGALEVDTDADGTPNCIDGCPDDPGKTAPGACGCGKPDTDTDKDTVADCIDVCSNGDDRKDKDKDGVPDCVDECPDDSEQSVAGQCGCGVIEVDPDQDGVASCVDNCPMNINSDQADADEDGLGDLCDGCPNDPEKSAPGVCGCGAVDIDTDKDGLFDCADPCPTDPTAEHLDSDEDGLGDVCDGCPFDKLKSEPGQCGCGIPDADTDADGVPGCLDQCPNTAPGVAVDEVGCAPVESPPPQPTPGPDADDDGVADEDDDCPDTPADVDVDTNGCPLADGGTGDTPCGSAGAVSMILIAMGLAGMRQRMR